MHVMDPRDAMLAHQKMVIKLMLYENSKPGGFRGRFRIFLNFLHNPLIRDARAHQNG